MKLTKAVLATLAVDAGKDERVVWDSEVRGLGIRLRASGARAWVIRPPRSGSGKSRLYTLGPGDTLDLPTARRVAQEKLGEVALGGDPSKARKEAHAQAAITLGVLLPIYLADKEKKGIALTTMGNLKHHFQGHWKLFHDRPLNSITRAEVAARHRQIAQDHPHAADRARSILSTFFVWAVREGLVENNPVANTNTATVPTRRDRVLSDDEVSAIWAACREDDFGRIVRLLMLTGLRRNEVAGMQWGELDLRVALWTIPAGRMKNKRSHEVPLSAPVIAILSEAPERSGREFVFGDGDGAFSGFSRAKASLDKRISGAVAPWTLHDIRRTASTGMNTLGVLPHLVEAVLSHVSGHKAGVAGTYNRALYRREKREALDLWAAEVARITGATTAKSD